MSRHQKTPSGNIKSVIALEENDRRQHSAAERAFHAIGHSVGTIWFVILQGLWIGSWVIWNISQPAYFDPYPFSLLSVILTIEAVFLASFVLMNQNAADLQAERRNQRRITHAKIQTIAISLLRVVCTVPGLVSIEDTAE